MCVIYLSSFLDKSDSRIHILGRLSTLFQRLLTLSEIRTQFQQFRYIHMLSTTMYFDSSHYPCTDTPTFLIVPDPFLMSLSCHSWWKPSSIHHSPTYLTWTTTHKGAQLPTFSNQDSGTYVVYTYLFLSLTPSL